MKRQIANFYLILLIMPGPISSATTHDYTTAKNLDELRNFEETQWEIRVNEAACDQQIQKNNLPFACWEGQLGAPDELNRLCLSLSADQLELIGLKRALAASGLSQKCRGHLEKIKSDIEYRLEIGSDFEMGTSHEEFNLDGNPRSN